MGAEFSDHQFGLLLEVLWSIHSRLEEISNASHMNPDEVAFVREMMNQMRCHCGRNYLQSIEERSSGCGNGHNLKLIWEHLRVFPIEDKVTARKVRERLTGGPK